MRFSRSVRRSVKPRISWLRRLPTAPASKRRYQHNEAHIVPLDRCPGWSELNVCDCDAQAPLRRELQKGHVSSVQMHLNPTPRCRALPSEEVSPTSKLEKCTVSDHPSPR